MARPVHRVLGVRPLAGDAFVLRVERLGFPFRPGQHVTLGLHGAGINREYSIYSAPQDDALEFLIRVRGGSVSARLLRDAAPGTPLDLAGPFGAFGVGDPAAALGRRHLFVATGAGVAPFHSIVRGVPGLDYTLVHGVRAPDEAHDRAHYEAARHVVCASSGAAPPAFAGRVTDWLAGHPVAADSRVCLCGHAGMVSEVYDRLRARGVPSDNLLTEVFF